MKESKPWHISPWAVVKLTIHFAHFSSNFSFQSLNLVVPLYQALSCIWNLSPRSIRIGAKCQSLKQTLRNVVKHNEQPFIKKKKDMYIRISLPDLKLPGDKRTWHNEDVVLLLHSCSLIIWEFEKHKYAMNFFPSYFYIPRHDKKRYFRWNILIMALFQLSMIEKHTAAIRYKTWPWGSF